MKLSRAARTTAPSSTIKLSDKVRELERRGRKILRFELGEPQFSTPMEISTAAIQALKKGETRYSHSRGIQDLRQELCDFYNRRYGSTFDPQKNVIVTPGVKQGLLYVFYALLDRGDEVLVPNPGWTSYDEMVQLVGGKPVSYDISRATDFAISLDAIKIKRTRRTKALILNSPNNPTGRTISKKILKDIQCWCDANNIVLISDEIYDRFVYDGKKYASILDVNPKLTNAVLLNGFSKSYAMTGWRLGYVLAEPELINALVLFQQNAATCPSTFSQRGAIAALKKGERHIAQMLKIYERNREMVVKALNGIPGIHAIRPDGGLYVFANISSIMGDAGAFCEDLLERGSIAVTPGEAFGSNGKGFIRMCIAAETKTLRQAMNTMRTLYT